MLLEEKLTGLLAGKSADQVFINIEVLSHQKVFVSRVYVAEDS